MSALDRLGIRETPCVPARYSPNQEQTKDAFAFNWAKRELYESERVQKNSREWLFDRYCDGNADRLDEWLNPEGGPKLILDAGCGSSYSACLFFGERLKQHDYLGIDISAAVTVARTRFLEKGYPGDFLQCDLMTFPAPEASLDMIFAEGVLHHTDSTREALLFLSRKLKRGGYFLFYVYRKKAAIREFTDDCVRDGIRGMGDDEAWEALRPLTKLGKALGELKMDIEIPEDIPLLGIEKGKVDLQRFFYWNICKAYYRPEFTVEEMNAVNFDWYRPLNCHRHTPAEIEAYCEAASLRVERMDVQSAGITVVGVRQ